MQQLFKKNFIFLFLIFCSKLNAMEKTQDFLPIIYREEYNVSIEKILTNESIYNQVGKILLSKLIPNLTQKVDPTFFNDSLKKLIPGLLDKLQIHIHPFDGEKYEKIYKYLREIGITAKFFCPELVSEADLLSVHSPKYLESLKDSKVVNKIVEIGNFLDDIPNETLQKHLLDPMRYATQGTIIGCELALKYDWAINLSGGYHHAKADQGGGFCFFADIPIAVYKILEKQNDDFKVLIVDLDAHQGNGLEAIFKKGIFKNNKKQIYIFDMFSFPNYPNDMLAATYIDFRYNLLLGTTTEIYLKTLKENLPDAIKQIKPNLIVYNAGSDIFEKDPLGKLSVSADGIIQRDAFVFSIAKENNIPILMVLSGGYSKESGQIIGKSIENILKNVLKVI
jgi:histone deacetylase 11